MRSSTGYNAVPYLYFIYFASVKIVVIFSLEMIFGGDLVGIGLGSGGKVVCLLARLEENG